MESMVVDDTDTDMMHTDMVGMITEDDMGTTTMDMDIIRTS